MEPEFLRRAAKCIAGFVLAWSASAKAAEWKIAEGPLLTRWAKDVKADQPLPEYPRPQLVRKDWLNLNGLWQLDLAAKADTQPQFGSDLKDSILVPYPVESALSGVMKHVDRLTYRRTFDVPKEWKDKRVLLHFGAVDWMTDVFVNGKKIGSHTGGFDAFHFDITDALKSSGAQELIVTVFDPTDAGDQPRGKQVNKPGGIFYTGATGIWQTVWLEPVAAEHVDSIKIVPDVDNGSVRIVINAGDAGSRQDASVEVLDRDNVVGKANGAAGSPIKISVPQAKLWTPENPFLYSVRVTLGSDAVESYFGMRKISIGKDEQGVQRLLLNGKFVFQVGPLDQGFWPDGIYTAPTDEALKFDIEETKKLGFNMTRKHVKVEPERWYYWCDKLGLLVWQDMPAGDNKTPAGRAQFDVELKRLVEGRQNHPSIVMWVVFNEGWGEHDVPRHVEMVRQLDPSRLVNNASGWTDMKVGDVIDMHHYPDPDAPPTEPTRAAVLGEFGGLGLPIKGHTWSKDSWGYRGVGGTEQLTSAYEHMLARAYELKDKAGLCAIVYTQITDVETECNGLLTYDRELVKLDETRGRAANTGHGPKIRQLLATSQKQPATWRFTTDKPADGWNATTFDDSAWKEGPAGFGTEGTPGAVVRTVWNTQNIWIRRTFEVPPGEIKNPVLLLHHDDDAEVYLNGVEAFKAPGYVGSYENATISEAAKATLKPGKNTIAIHCNQHSGGQYIDAGIIDFD